MAASLLSFWYRFVEPFTDWFQVFSFVASLITIICFAITLFQLWNVKNTNVQIKEVLDSNRKRISSALSVIKVTDALRLSDMVITLIRNEKYEQAALRLHDFNNASIEIASYHTSFKKYQLTLPSEINHLFELTKENNSTYRPEYILQSLQKLNDELMLIESEVKSNVIKH